MSHVFIPPPPSSDDKDDYDDNLDRPNAPPPIKRARSIARILLNGGVPPKDVEDKLVERGVARFVAHDIVDELGDPDPILVSRHGIPPPDHELGQRNMAFGAMWFLGGLAVTVISLAAAGGTGTYVVAWGAIVFGGIQFFRGLSQSWPEGPPLAATYEKRSESTESVERSSIGDHIERTSFDANAASSPATNLVKLMTLLAIGLAVISLVVCLGLGMGK